MTSYSINGSVGSLVEGSTSYEGDGATFTSAGAISMSEQRTDNFGGFFLPRNIEITTTETDNGKEAVNTSALNIQSFDISVDMSRRAGEQLIKIKNLESNDIDFINEKTGLSKKRI